MVYSQVPVPVTRLQVFLNWYAVSCVCPGSPVSFYRCVCPGSPVSFYRYCTAPVLTGSVPCVSRSPGVFLPVYRYSTGTSYR